MVTIIHHQFNTRFHPTSSPHYTYGPTKGLGAADKWIIHLSAGSTQPAVNTIRTNFPLELSLAVYHEVIILQLGYVKAGHTTYRAPRRGLADMGDHP